MENIMRELLEFETEHPARVIEFLELTQGLFAEVESGNVLVNYHPEFPHLALFKYTQDCVVNRKWSKFSMIARGLILDLKNKTVVATPFPKFFNYGEVDCKFDIDEDTEITEKMDGSLGILFFFEGEFRVATGGSFVSDQAKWTTQWVNNNIDLDTLDKKNTYLFEIIYHENKIVVNYEFEGLVLLAIYDSYGLEYSYDQIQWEANHRGIRCAKRYNFSDMNSLLEKASTLTMNEEGYVVRFKNGQRFKVKGDEYLRIHRLMTKVTPLAIWEALVEGNDLEELKMTVPEEMEKDLYTIINIFDEKLRDYIKEVTRLYEKSKFIIDDKELALYMKDHPDEFKSEKFPTASNYIFSMRKCNFYRPVRKYGSYMRRKVFEAFRPKYNHLEGYKPSLFVSMFTTNNNG